MNATPALKFCAWRVGNFALVFSSAFLIAQHGGADPQDPLDVRALLDTATLSVGLYYAAPDRFDSKPSEHLLGFVRLSPEKVTYVPANDCYVASSSNADADAPEFCLMGEDLEWIRSATKYPEIQLWNTAVTRAHKGKATTEDLEKLAKTIAETNSDWKEILSAATSAVFLSLQSQNLEWNNAWKTGTLNSSMRGIFSTYDKLEKEKILQIQQNSTAIESGLSIGESRYSWEDFRLDSPASFEAAPKLYDWDSAGSAHRVDDVAQQTSVMNTYSLFPTDDEHFIIKGELSESARKSLLEVKDVHDIVKAADQYDFELYWSRPGSPIIEGIRK